ncbi:MAG: NAD-dependent epimerase/dehydratase family protein [Bacteroidota bacterium]
MSPNPKSQIQHPKSGNPKSKIAFVTGGTGFVGSHLVEALLERGYDEVRCLVRDRQKWLGPLDITPVRGDLTDVEALWKGLQGVDEVYHVAGITRAEDWDTFYQANVRGTLNLLGAVKQVASDVDRVLITSSLAAVGRGADGAATEDDPLQPVSRYGRSKAEMEEALRSTHQMPTSYWEDLPITVVRPPAVYGPRDRDILTFFQAVNSHVCPVVGGGSDPAVSLVHVRDLAQGMIQCATHPDALRAVFFLGSPRPYAWNEVKAASTAALDTWAVTMPVPSFLVGALGAASELWGKVTGSYPALNREKAREIRYAATMCSSEKARRMVGYEPAIALDEGVAETIAWYREQEWL